ncbi:hypothetical protein P2318_27070 [Myxococcaceae bacterium GXIMD 01537]
MFIRGRQAVGVLVALAALGMGCSSSKAQRAPQSVEDRADAMEAQNRALEAQIAQKNQAVEEAFRKATQAESAAGIVNLGCAGVMAAAAPAPGMPRSGAAHAQLGLARKAFRVTPSFSAARTSGGWRISQGNCQVVGQ